METKPFWTSKTMWANGLALLGSVTLGLGFDLGLDAESQAAIVGGIMALVNIALRFVTSSGVTIGELSD